MKYETWLNFWLKNYIQPMTKERTYTRYREIVHQHLIPNFGEYELSKLTVLLLQNYVTELLKSGNLKTKQGLSPNSVNCIITVIKSSLKRAFCIDLVPENIASKIMRPKIIEKPISCFSMTEQKQIEKAVLKDKRVKMIGIVICLYSGLRIGELLALEWSDVDLQRGIITVNRSCHDEKGQRVTDTPKTLSSKRTIPLPKQLIPTLREQKKRSVSLYCLSDEIGNPLSIRSYQRSFELLLAKLKIEKKRFHALRHTFATRALECGMDVKTLSEILGHKNPTVTLNRYVHSMFDHKKNMMNKLGKLLE